MRKLLTTGIIVMTAAVVLTGCANGKTGETGASNSSEASSEAGAQAFETEEYVAESSIKLGKYKGIELTVAKAEATEEELNAQIQQILDANPDYSEVNREAKEGDTVNINYKGLLNGEAFEGGTDEEFDLELGSNSFIEGFEEGLVGVKKGEQKNLNLTFPDPYQNAELAGKDVVFEVTVNAVKEKKVPELNDEFIQKISPNDGTVENFKEELAKSIVEQKQYDIETQRNIDLMEAILNDSEVVCATDDIKAEYEIQIASYTSQAQMYGMQFADFASVYGMDESQFKNELYELARDITKQKIVYQEISKLENIVVTDEDKTNLAKANGHDTVDALIEAYSAKEVETAALSQKVLDFLLENSVIKTVSAEEAAGTTAP